jgi:hypothetical protein
MPLKAASSKSKVKQGAHKVTEILETGNFIRRVRSAMRLGKFSRERLNLMRIEVRTNEAACDWIARPVDIWDADLPRHIRERHYAMQTIEDALTMREILFDTFGGIHAAELRAYQRSDHDEPELVMTGTAYRNDEQPARTIATAMRAKLLGFRFSLTDGALERLISEYSPQWQ